MASNASPWPFVAPSLPSVPQPLPLPMPVLYLIDGHAQFFRAYHAIRPGMTSPVTKEPTNLTFGFVGILLKLLRDYQPDYLAVVIDVGGDRENFRAELYPEYKANRQETPDDFHPQVERCVEVLGHMGVPVVGQAGVEADDVIASLVRRLEREHDDLEIRIVSRDKDLAQLIGDRVELLDIYKDQTIRPEQLFGVEGVMPEQVADILALMGDPVDNVPGVPGVGPKTAAQLILRYGSLDLLLANLDDIKGKRRQTLHSRRAAVAPSPPLGGPQDDPAGAPAPETARCDLGSLLVDSLLGIFRELGFNRAQQDLLALTRGGAVGDEPAGDSLFAGHAPPPPEPADQGE